MTTRKIKPPEYDRICEGLYMLTDMLVAVGVAELKISTKEETIFWDTQGGGQVDPGLLPRFFDRIEALYHELLSEAAVR